jgi:hypothetical protein
MTKALKNTSPIHAHAHANQSPILKTKKGKKKEIVQIEWEHGIKLDSLTLHLYDNEKNPLDLESIFYGITEIDSDPKKFDAFYLSSKNPSYTYRFGLRFKGQYIATLMAGFTTPNRPTISLKFSPSWVRTLGAEKHLLHIISTATNLPPKAFKKAFVVSKAEVAFDTPLDMRLYEWYAKQVSKQHEHVGNTSKTFYFGSRHSPQQKCVYDKKTQLLEKKHVAIPDAHMTRIESRLYLAGKMTWAELEKLSEAELKTYLKGIEYYHKKPLLKTLAGKPSIQKLVMTHGLFYTLRHLPAHKRVSLLKTISPHKVDIHSA